MSEAEQIAALLAACRKAGFNVNFSLEGWCKVWRWATNAPPLKVECYDGRVFKADDDDTEGILGGPTPESAFIAAATAALEGLVEVEHVQ